MQIANGTLILCPENHQFVRGITPAEAIILYKMHRQNANGSPLGEFFIQDGEAVTVDVPEKAAQEPVYKESTGERFPAKPAVPAVTHTRTNAEEVLRLKKKYTGIITENGLALPAFQATFGNASAVKLPEKFSELDEIGHIFKEQSAPTSVENGVSNRNVELLGKTRAQVCDIASEVKVRVHASDTKEQIIGAIIEAEIKASPSPAVKSE